MAVAIVPFGYKTQKGRELLKLMHAKPDEFYEPLDIRDLMPRDPNSNKRTYKLGHDENGDFKRTQLALLADSRFFAAVRSIIDSIEDKLGPSPT